MGFFSKKTESIKARDASRIIAEGIADTFSCAAFEELFAGREMESGWSKADALGVWYSLGNFALVVAAWSEFGKTPQKVNLVLDYVRPELIKRWNMPSETLARMLDFIQETEGQAMAAFTSCTEGSQLASFFSRYASRILGETTMPLSNKSMFEAQLMGLEARGNDILLSVSLSGKFFAVSTPTKNVLKQTGALWV